MASRDERDTLIPTLPAYRDADGVHYLVWCKFCRRYHHHRGPLTDAPRLAHCPTDSLSPYGTTGYKLRDSGPASARMMKQAGRQPLQPEGRSG